MVNRSLGKIGHYKLPQIGTRSNNKAVNTTIFLKLKKKIILKIQFQIGLIQKCLEHYSALGYFWEVQDYLLPDQLVSLCQYFYKTTDSKYWISDDSQFFAMYIVWCWWLIVSYYLIITQTRPLSACDSGMISLK